MKKLIFPLVLCGVCSVAFAADKPAQTADAAAVKPVPAAQNQPVQEPKMTQAEQKKEFKTRQKQLKKLLKQYRKASDTEKPAIKAQLAEVVSESIDANLAYAKRRIAAERANLDNWEAKLQETEQNLDAYKNKRVEDLLSGEAERKYKAAKKAWKKQLKEAKKNIR